MLQIARSRLTKTDTKEARFFWHFVASLTCQNSEVTYSKFNKNEITDLVCAKDEKCSIPNPVQERRLYSCPFMAAVVNNLPVLLASLCALKNSLHPFSRLESRKSSTPQSLWLGLVYTVCKKNNPKQKVMGNLTSPHFL